MVTKRMQTIAEHLVRLGLPRDQFFMERRLSSHVVAIDDVQAFERAVRSRQGEWSPA